MGREVRKPLAALFGGLVSVKRRQLGMSQKALAGLLGISQESLSRMETGMIAPRFERLQDFADALGCEVADLFRQPRATEGRADALARTIRPLSEQEQNSLLEIIIGITRIVAGRKRG
ncbi:MAG: helix-turn-helix transcriptional regulator [Desulfovibrionaceae bacterium]|nr:helix-turn-helix transcriptional regulator [Desulfovibrionaceae bacterium]